VLVDRRERPYEPFIRRLVRRVVQLSASWAVWTLAYGSLGVGNALIIVSALAIIASLTGRRTHETYLMRQLAEQIPRGSAIGALLGSAWPYLGAAFNASKAGGFRFESSIVLVQTTAAIGVLVAVVGFVPYEWLLGCPLTVDALLRDIGQNGFMPTFAFRLVSFSLLALACVAAIFGEWPLMAVALGAAGVAWLGPRAVRGELGT
jgi:hypothetical protein